MEPGTLILIVGRCAHSGGFGNARRESIWSAGARRVPGARHAARLGRVGGIEFSDVRPRPTVGIAGLAVILFDVGSRRRGDRFGRDRACCGAQHGRRLVTASVSALAAKAVFPLSWPASFLLGAVIASTDAAAVFSTLRVTSLRRRLVRVLEGESGANDPMGVALTIGLIEWVDGSATGVADLALLVVRQLALGLAVGLAVGAASAWLLIRLPTIAVPLRRSRASRSERSASVSRTSPAAAGSSPSTSSDCSSETLRPPCATPRQLPQRFGVPRAGRPLHRARPVLVPAPAGGGDPARARGRGRAALRGTARPQSGCRPSSSGSIGASACCSAGPGCAERCRSCSRPTHRPPGCRRAARSSTRSSSSSSHRR